MDGQALVGGIKEQLVLCTAKLIAAPLATNTNKS